MPTQIANAHELGEVGLDLDVESYVDIASDANAHQPIEEDSSRRERTEVRELHADETPEE